MSCQAYIRALVILVTLGSAALAQVPSVASDGNPQTQSASVTGPALSSRDSGVEAVSKLPDATDGNTSTGAGPQTKRILYIVPSEAQAAKSYPGFHQGAVGYGRHTLVDPTSENYFVEGFMPILFREDTRYYTLERGGAFRRSWAPEPPPEFRISTIHKQNARGLRPDNAGLQASVWTLPPRCSRSSGLI